MADYSRDFLLPDDFSITKQTILGQAMEATLTTDELDSGHGLQTRHPECNGLIYESPPGTLHLVVDGIARSFPTDALYKSIHYRTFMYHWHDGATHGANKVTPVHRPKPNMDWIERRMMDPNVHLAKAPGDKPVFLIMDEKKWGIPSKNAFNDYQFDWDKIYIEHQSVIDDITTSNVRLERNFQRDFSETHYPHGD